LTKYGYPRLVGTKGIFYADQLSSDKEPMGGFGMGKSGVIGLVVHSSPWRHIMLLLLLLLSLLALGLRGMRLLCELQALRTAMFGDYVTAGGTTTPPEGPNEADRARFGFKKTSSRPGSLDVRTARFVQTASQNGMMPEHSSLRT